MTNKNRQRIEKLEEPVESRAREENRRAIRTYHAYLQLEFWHLEENCPELAEERLLWDKAINVARDAIMGSSEWRDNPDSITLPEEINCNAPELESLYDASDEVYRKIDHARLAGHIPLVPDEDLLQKAAAAYKTSPDEVRTLYESKVLQDLIYLKEEQHGVDLDVYPPPIPPTDVIKAIAAEEQLSFEALKHFFESHELNPAKIRAY
jgi:hypothetical protein